MTTSVAELSKRQDSDPVWMHAAWRELGTKEAPGDADNPRVQAYLRTVQRANVVHDETPWCSAFVNWCIEQGGLRGTKSAAARSWLHWGQPLAAPKRGCIVVLTRPGMPSNGHVAFFCGFAENGDLLLLGGNQNNKVCVKAYARARVIGYRWPDLDE